MPVVDAADATVWETRWRIGTGLHGPGDRTSRGEFRLGYHRAVMLPLCERRAAGLIEGLGHDQSDRIIIIVVGAGFGCTAECLQVRLADARIAATDTSSLIQARASSGETDDVRLRAAAAGFDPDRSINPGGTLGERLYRCDA